MTPAAYSAGILVRYSLNHPEQIPERDTSAIMDLQAQIDADALEAQKLTRKHFVVGLDFSMEGLSELDALCDDVGFALKGGLNDDNLEWLGRCWGAYLGEVIRRAATSHWFQDPRTGQAVLDVNGQVVDPCGHVRKRLQEGKEHALPAFAEAAIREDA